ncbi:MAG: SusE domain-containing protein [Marinilabilia sp.]
MKNIKFLFVALLGVIGLYSCDQTDDEPMVGTYTPPAITIPEAGANYVLSEKGAENLIEVMEWEPADFGFDAAVDYTVEVDGVDGDFSEPYELATSNSTDLRLKVKELNDAAIEYLEPEEPGELLVRLKAELHDDVEVLYSDPVTISVVPYSTLKVIEPLFIVGDVLGSDHEWDNNNYTYIMFRDSDDPNVFDYTYTGHFNAGGYKLLPELGNWDRQFGLIDGELVKDDGGSGNITIEEDGYYTININTDEVTFSQEPYDASGDDPYDMIGLIGEFTEWESDHEMTQSSYDPHIWTADDVELPEGEVKFRANGAWDTNWGAADSFPYGQADINGDNIVVPEGTYFVKFNSITGHYVFYEK